MWRAAHTGAETAATEELPAALGTEESLAAPWAGERGKSWEASYEHG